jgi:hypothetical protein
MSSEVFINVPQIKVIEPEVWTELEHKYISSVVVKEGSLNFTEIFWYLAHIRNRSEMVHSIVEYIIENRSGFARKYGHEYRLLKGTILESFFGLRESLACLVNCVWNLEEDFSKVGATQKVMKKAQKDNLEVFPYLKEIIPRDSMLDNYLQEFRHNYIHREDMSNITIPDMTAAMVGSEQPRIINFIDKTQETSLKMRKIEAAIANECTIKLGLS